MTSCIALTYVRLASSIMLGSCRLFDKLAKPKAVIIVEGGPLGESVLYRIGKYSWFPLYSSPGFPVDCAT